jgi:bifunctional non-homologous end joining protein LigD
MPMQTKQKTKMPNLIGPMLATFVNRPFDSKDWIFELKWDGYRALAKIQNHTVHLYSRNFLLFDHRYPDIINDLHSLKKDAILDGEIVVLDNEGKPSFQLVQNYQGSHEGSLVYYVFDLLYLAGNDIRHLPLTERKKLLKKLLPDIPHVRYCDDVKEKGKAFFQATQREGFEGIIGKQSRSPYLSGRSRYWVKIKTHQRQEAIICGFTAPKGGREKFGSLLLGVYENHQLVFVGHAGSGFDRLQLNNVYQRLKPLIQEVCPFASLPKLTSQVTWVKPIEVCEVKFAEWTKGGQMRQAVFVDMRDDKKAAEVVREQPQKMAIRNSQKEDIWLNPNAPRKNLT